MPFFVPNRLIELEYLGGDSDEDKEYQQLAKDYTNEIDFAFFVVNFNYTRSDYDDLTPKNKAFILKAWENKLVSDNTLIRNATLNAQANINRKKGKKFIDLWNRKQEKLDEEIAHENLKIVELLETDKSWVQKIYQANGIRQVLKKGG